MVCDPEYWCPKSFFRQPIWRTLRASYLVEENGKPDPRIDDEWVTIAQGLFTKTKTGDRTPLAPEVRDAFELWTANQKPRWILEARLLTAQTLSEVAEACSLPESVVATYGKLFFDVRPRLHHTDWVLAIVVRSTPWNVFAGPQPAGMLRYFAFVGGASVLDTFIAVTLDCPLPDRVREGFCKNPAMEEKHHRLKAKLAIASLSGTSTSQLASVVKLTEQFHELETEAGLETRERRPFLPGLGEFLSGISRASRNGAPGDRASTPPEAATACTRRPGRTVPEPHIGGRDNA
ncbi:MAG: hypothetical protein K8U57_00595 [Planctomycetes bacterium]|nr:hypothetical protein [Planctomycetota bacterium]